MRVAVLFVAIAVTSVSHAADYGFFLDPNPALSATAPIPAKDTLPKPQAVRAPEPDSAPRSAPDSVRPAARPAPEPAFSRIPTALPATVSTVVRIRHEWRQSNGLTRIDHGTGCLVDGLLLTARHVIEGEGTNICEIDGEWVPCRLVAEDKDIDIALLEPLAPVQPRPYRVVDGCHSSVKGTPIAVLPMRRLSTLWMNIPGFHHGASGSPLIENNRVIAVAIAIRSEAEPHLVNIVPYATWAHLWEQARSHARVASK